MFLNPVRLTSKAPLCFHSVITTSQQAVNSAPLAAVSPTMAIKSTLIPHPSLLQRGEGQSVSWYTNRGPVWANAHYFVAKPCSRCDEVECTHRKQNGEGWKRAPFWLDLILTYDVGPYANSRACAGEWVGALLAGLLQHYLPTTAAAAIKAMGVILIQHTPPISTAVRTFEVQNSSAISTRRLTSNSRAWFFRACVLLSAAKETQWRKPQEAYELTERAWLRVYNTVSVPLAH